MANGETEGPGLLRRLWNWAVRAGCSILCAWKEILILVLVWVATAYILWITVIFVIAFVTEFFLTSPLGPAQWAVHIIIAIVILILILILIAILTVVHYMVAETVRKKLWACWQAC